jgi:tetratricopeptide (TPR) repeat protein
MKRFSSLILLFGMSVFVSITSAQHLTSAKLYLSLKQYVQAEASALKAVEKDPQDEEAWFVLGKSRYELKKYSQMVEAFEKAAAIDPEEHKTEINNYRMKVWADSYNAGIKYYNLGRDTASYLQTAIESFKTAIVTMPDSTRTYYVCALAYYGNKQPDEAIKVLNISLGKALKADELKLLGQLHTQIAQEKADAKDDAGSKQEYAAAVTAFEKLFELDHSNVGNIMTLIEMYQFLGMSDKALALTRDAVAANPENRAFRYVYGVFFIKQDKFAEGIEQLNKVVQGVADTSDQVYSDAVYNLGIAYLNWGVALKKESDAKAEEAAKAKKKDYKEDLSYKEKFRSAVPYFEKATQLKQNDPGVWEQLAKLYANLNMSDKAKAAFKKVDELNK